MTTIAAAAAIAFSAAPLADAATVQPFGSREILADPGGMMVAAYTVTGLAPSSDSIPYQVMGRLYEATVTVEAERGTVTPVIPPFMARSASGRNYPELAGVPTDQGLSPMSLMQGERSTGKLYFDVVGDVPNSVAYNDGAQDLMLWVGPPAAAAPAPAPPPEAMPMPAPPPMMPAPMMPPPPAAPMMPAPPPAAPMMPAPPPPPAAPMMPPAPGTPGY